MCHSMSTGWRRIALWLGLSFPRLVASVGLLLLAVAWSPASLAAATVTDLGDNGAAGQLRTLITGAASGDTIGIPPGTITLTAGQLQVSKDLVILGADPGACASSGLPWPCSIVDGNSKDRVFFISGAPVAPSLTMSAVVIQNGKPRADGGGGILNFGRLALSNAIVRNNNARGGRTQADVGGGLCNDVGATMTLNNVTVTGNSAIGGGGIFNHVGGSATLTDVTVSGNNTQDILGGAGVYNAGTATLNRVTISGNTTGGFGGGMANGGVAVLTDVTVSGNTAVSAGALLSCSANALFCLFTQGSVVMTTLTNVTVAGNTATGVPGASAGGIQILNGTVRLANVIVSANTPSNCSSSVTSLGHNLDSGATCGFGEPGDLSNTSPNLGPLQDNGGFTLTHALLAGSPAIDAGANAGCPPTDQRGVIRPQGAACDIGAYESSGSPPSGLNLQLLVNGASFTSGSRFELDLVVANSGGATSQDFYFGVLPPPSVGGCPGSDPAVFFSAGFTNPILTCLSAASPNVAPFARNIAVPPVPPTTVAPFFSFVWPSSSPAGLYGFFGALTDAGTLNSRALGTATVTFTP